MRKALAPSQLKKRLTPPTKGNTNETTVDHPLSITPNAHSLKCGSHELVAKPSIQASRSSIHRQAPFKSPLKVPLPSASSTTPSNIKQITDATPEVKAVCEVTSPSTSSIPVKRMGDGTSDQGSSVFTQPVPTLKRIKMTPSTVHPASSFRPPLMAHKALSNSGHGSVAGSSKNAVNEPANSLKSGFDRCFSVMWRKKTNKKHHTWDDDVPIDDYKRGRCFMPSMNQSTEALVSPSTTLPKFNKKHTLSVVRQHTQEDSKAVTPQPRHSPDAPNAIVMPRPSPDHPRLRNRVSTKRVPGSCGIADVVVDPVLGQHLRPHQIEGVKFLYECMMQLKENVKDQGAILADEMGLGKTLQTITLLWTLLKQSPFYEEEKAVIKRALIVCPASLILLRMVQDELKRAAFDIVICDEGHRLKTSNIKTTQAIRALPTRRRIILSGTPIQNDLGEFFSMIDFVTPGLFESYSTFKRLFEDPIVRSRQPGCSIAEADLGKARSLEIIRSQTTEKVVLVSSFTQTLDILQKLCEISGYGFYRLDGSTPTTKRQEYVEKFNAGVRDKYWNPSVDQQAMARIHRDGQQRNVFVYRLLSTGTIEEKIFQRQLTKIGLSDALMDDKAEDVNKFSIEQLRDLFTFHEDESCQTHSLLGCDCLDSQSGESSSSPRLSRRSSSALSDRVAEERAQNQLREWAHYNVQDWLASPVQAQVQTLEQDQGARVAAELASKDRVLWKIIERDQQQTLIHLPTDTCGSGDSDDTEEPSESPCLLRPQEARLAIPSAVPPATYRGIATFVFVKQLK
ncbi:helicase [Actinomortierella wolfii]|nr:helicase [Actinomortierella wolfii]